MKKKSHKEAEDNNNRRKKKQKLLDAPVAEPDPVADMAGPIHTKKKKKKDNKSKNNDNRNREALITDERFSSAHSDPRFQRMPRRESKVAIDSRFARMLSDASFVGSTAPVDKRGRPKRGKAENPLLHYYLQQGDEGEEPIEPQESKIEMEMNEKDEDEEEEAEDGPGSDADAGSSSEEDVDEEDQFSVNSDIAGYLMANHKDTPLIENETHRLAIVNMDWDHIKAVDLYVVLNSCLPKGGQLLSVAIYPSEFGLKCMEVEAVRGPFALFDDSSDHSDKDSKNDSDGPSALVDDNNVHSEDDFDGSSPRSDDNDTSGTHSEDGYESDNEKLRTYELNKLRYYYAVVVCDSSATANHIYKNLDGTELLTTSNVFDLRFIPDSMEFKHPPRDITTEAPTSYEEPDFHTRALQHSKVKLTWEEDEPRRKKILRRKFNPNQLDEFKDYLASTSESDSNDDDGDDKGSKKHRDIEMLRSLLQPDEGSDAAASSEENDMEITFSTGLEDLSKRILEKKDKKSETVWEAVLRRKSEKKKARKNRSKYSSEDDSSDSDIQEAPDQPDDFFVEEEETVSKNKSKKRGKKNTRNGREEPPEMNKEKEASRAELELLLADDQDGKHGPKGYNLKHNKAKGKKGKDLPANEDKLPNVDYKTDPRFSALLDSHEFARDPTNPQYKRSAEYLRQRSRKHEASGVDEAAKEEAEDPSEQVQMQPDDVMADGVASSEKEKHNFSSTVRSLKRSLVTMKKESKRR